MNTSCVSPRRRRPIAAMVAVLLAVVSSACSADSRDSASTVTATVTPDPVVSSVDQTSAASASKTTATAESTTTPSGPRLEQGAVDKLQAVLEAIVVRGSPDAIAAVITPHGVWAGAAGVDGPNGRRATPQDEFAISSISKTFTAAAILKLAEQGTIDLDKPLAGYLGGITVDSNGATIRQALAMYAGLGPTADSVVAEVYANPTRVWSADQVVSKIDPRKAAPGTAYEYSNPGYKLVGFAAATANRRSWSKRRADRP